MSQTYVGAIAFDGGGNKLKSRMTNPASFLVIGDWVRSVIEYHQGELNYNPDCEWREIRVLVYVNDDAIFTAHAEPIEEVVLRSPFIH